MKYLLILLFIINLNLLFSQNDTLNRTDENNKRYGYWVISNDKGEKVEEGVYVNGRKEGIWKGFYPDGKLKHEITFKNNRADGYAKFYYPTGIVSEEGLWRGNKWVGEYKYNHPNGKPSYEWTYNEQGKRTGVQKYYHENGNIMIEGEWQDGKESGILKEYDVSGNIISEKNFTDGKLDVSSVKIFTPTTKTSPETKSSEPVIVKEAVRDSNNPPQMFDGNGYHITYTRERKKDREGEWRNGRLIEGKRYHYDEEGNLTKTSIYKNGNIVDIIYPN